MKFIEPDCTIHLNGNILVFEGNLIPVSYVELNEYLEDIDLIVPGKELIFDFKKLNFLNTQGLHALSRFFEKTKKKILIDIRHDIQWQRVAFLPLSTKRVRVSIIPPQYKK